MLARLVLFGLFVYARLAQGLQSATDDTLHLSAAQVIATIRDPYDDERIRIYSAPVI